MRQWMKREMERKGRTVGMRGSWRWRDERVDSKGGLNDGEKYENKGVANIPREENHDRTGRSSGRAESHDRGDLTGYLTGHLTGYLFRSDPPRGGGQWMPRPEIPEIIR